MKTTPLSRMPHTCACKMNYLDAWVTDEYYVKWGNSRLIQHFITSQICTLFSFCQRLNKVDRNLVQGHLLKTTFPHAQSVPQLYAESVKRNALRHHLNSESIKICIILFLLLTFEISAILYVLDFFLFVHYSYE